MRRVRLAQVQRVRFLNPTLVTEFRRALEGLAGSHNCPRRTVRPDVQGEGAAKLGVQGRVEEHNLNLLSPEGMRRVPLAQVQRVRFLNPTLDTEFRRALEVLAGSHNSQRRTVSLHVKGEGKRNVKLGYAV